MWELLRIGGLLILEVCAFVQRKACIIVGNSQFEPLIRSPIPVSGKEVKKGKSEI